MATLFPIAFTWAGVMTDIGDLIANPIVIGALGFVFALSLGPKAVRSLRSMIR